MLDGLKTPRKYSGGHQLAFVVAVRCSVHFHDTLVAKSNSCQIELIFFLEKSPNDGSGEQLRHT